MKELVIMVRNGIGRFVYKNFCRKIFFLMDAESIHEKIITVGRALGSNILARRITGLFFNYGHPALRQEILGIKFGNPLGLAAGFDKDAYLTDILPEVGFGFEEVGSITGEPCKGNPKPRLWRLVESQSLVVYYGLKNEGSEAVSARLKNKKFDFPIGISIAKTNSPAMVDTEAGIADYFKAYEAFADIGDYCAVNISCPNAYGGAPFSGKEKLERLLSKLETVPAKKPIFLKISPDLSEEELDGILNVSARHKIAGFICTNLTKKRAGNPKITDSNVPEKGGISGKAIEEISNKFIADVYRKTGGRYVIMGVGGITSAEGAYKKIRLGASLLQLITGMIFDGPGVISEINRGLVKLLRRDGFKNISEAVGADHRQIEKN